MKASMQWLCVISIVCTLTGLGEAKVSLENTVGAWLFDDEKTDLIEDITGNGNDGIVKVEPEWVEGPFGFGVEFASSAQSIEVPDTDALNFGEESFSVVVWFTFDTPQDWNRLVRERTPGPWGAGNDGWELQTQGTQVHWSLDDKAGHHKKNSYANAGNGEWRHTAMIVDRDEQKLISYLDGANELSVDIADIESVTSALPVVIGNGLAGGIDEFAVFNTVISVDDVLLIMQSGLAEALGGAAVSSTGKLVATWGDLKASR